VVPVALALLAIAAIVVGLVITIPRLTGQNTAVTVITGSSSSAPTSTPMATATPSERPTVTSTPPVVAPTGPPTPGPQVSVGPVVVDAAGGFTVTFPLVATRSNGSVQLTNGQVSPATNYTAIQPDGTGFYLAWAVYPSTPAIPDANALLQASVDGVVTGSGGTLNSRAFTNVQGVPAITFSISKGTTHTRGMNVLKGRTIYALFAVGTTDPPRGAVPFLASFKFTS